MKKIIIIFHKMKNKKMMIIIKKTIEMKTMKIRRE